MTIIPATAAGYPADTYIAVASTSIQKVSILATTSDEAAEVEFDGVVLPLKKVTNLALNAGATTFTFNVKSADRVTN
ncbi:hypothetical protein [Cohnella soli]|uniref:Uncharacterized protein n=1 Tax=Cohnella soli TaxID=425005 RepID=A0ABW0HWU4_9BACL